MDTPSPKSLEYRHLTFPTNNLATYSSIEAVNAFDIETLQPAEIMVFDKFFASGNVLDIGCGTGRTSIELHKRGLKVEAMDYSPTMIQRAKEKYPYLSFKVANAQSLPYSDNTFDMALFSFNGIDCLDEIGRKKALKEIYRVLRPHGIFAFTSHNPWSLKKNSFSLVGYYKTTHQSFGDSYLRYTTPLEQRRQLRKSRFKLVEIISHTSTHWWKFLRDPYPMYVAQKI